MINKNIQEAEEFGNKYKVVLDNSDSFLSIHQRKESPRIDFEESSIKDLKPEINSDNIRFPTRALQSISNASGNLRVHQASINLQSRASVFSRRKGVHHKLGFSSTAWKLGALRIVYYISKFLNVLFTSIEKFKFKLIDRSIFNLIDDKCSNYEFYRQNGMVKEKPGWFDRLSLKYKIIGSLALKFGNFLTFILQNELVFLPENKFKIIFDIILTIFITINVFYVPLTLSFQIILEDMTFGDIILIKFPKYIQVLEILINFNTAFYEQGKIIKNRSEIFTNYIKKDFFKDFIITTLPLAFEPFFQFSKLILILRIYRVKSTSDQLILVLNLRDKFSEIISLIKMMYMMMIISHFLACCWYYVARFEVEVLNAEVTWLTYYKLENDDWHIQYFTSLYWAIITAQTIGYGDISPQTANERVFVIIVACFTSVSFGFMISSMGSIFAQMNQNDELYLKKMAQINAYIKKRGLSEELKLKVRMYFEYYLKQNNDEEVSQLLMQIPKDLQKDVTVDLFEKYLLKAKFIENSITPKTIKNLCLVAKERKFQPEEIILKHGELVDRLIIVLNGELVCFTNNQTLKKFTKGYVLAERNFLSRSPILYSIKSTKQSLILEIHFDDLIEVLKESQEDREKFAMIQLNIKHNTNYKKFTDICEICSSNHDLSKCPFPFFQRNEKKVIKLFNCSEWNKRSIRSSRRDIKFAGYRTCRLEYLDSAIQYCLDTQLLRENEISNELLTNLGLPIENLKQLTLESAESDHSPSQKSKESEKKEDIKQSLEVILESQNSQSDDESLEVERQKSVNKQRKLSKQRNTVFTYEKSASKQSLQNGILYPNVIQPNKKQKLLRKDTQEFNQRKVYNLQELAQKNKIDRFSTQATFSQFRNLNVEGALEKIVSNDESKRQSNTNRIPELIERSDIKKISLQIPSSSALNRHYSLKMLDQIMSDYQEVNKQISFDEIDMQYLLINSIITGKKNTNGILITLIQIERNKLMYYKNKNQSGELSKWRRQFKKKQSVINRKSYAFNNHNFNNHN